MMPVHVYVHFTFEPELTFLKYGMNITSLRPTPVPDFLTH